MPSTTPETILKILSVGEMSCREIATELHISVSHARSAVCKLKQLKKVYIAYYRRDSDGGRLYPRAVYALGSKRDAAPIGALTPTELNSRYRKAKKTAVNSVFMLGVPVEERRLGRKSL